MASKQTKTSITTETKVKSSRKLLIRGGLIAGVSMSMALLFVFGDNIANMFRKKEVSSVIEWASIDVERIDDTAIYLNWATLKEEFSRQFTIERSIDRKKVETVAIVLAAEHSNKVTTYQYYDLDVERNQKYFYRFRFMDVLGVEKHSVWIEASAMPMKK